MGFGHIHIVGEIIQNYDALEPYMDGWLRYRISYCNERTGFSNTEGTVYIPNTAACQDLLDRLLDGINVEYEKALAQRNAVDKGL